MAIFPRFLHRCFSPSNSRIQPSGAEHMINPTNPSKTQLPPSQKKKRKTRFIILPTKEQIPIYRYYLFAKRRLKKELGKSNIEVPNLISYSTDDDDLFVWKGIIYGAINTPFEGGIFHLSLKMPYDYPFKPPTVKFKTKVYHPYIDRNGVIDVDILGKAWTPAISIEILMVSICSFLLNPDPQEDENQIAALYRRDRRQYDEIAREWTLKYAMST